MEKTKLLGVLKSFTTGELRSFEDFVNSPYFNKNEELKIFYKTLKSILSSRTQNPSFKRQEVFKRAFSKLKYDEKYFNHLCSWLLKLVERFLAIHGFENQGIHPEHILLQTYAERQLEKQYQHIHRKAERKLESSPYRNEAYYFQKYLLEDVAEKNFSMKRIRRYDPHLQHASDYFDIFLLAKKLRYLCAMIDRQKIIAEPYRKTMIDEIYSIIQRKGFLQIDLLAIYFELLQLLISTSPEQHFNPFKEKLKTVDAIFSSVEMRDFYYYGINFCIKMLKQGKRKYAEDLMQLYQDGIDGNYLLDDGKLSPWTFKNMVRLGLNLKKFDWVEVFIKDYYDKLDQEVQSDALHFNMADLFYHKREFDNTLLHLNKVEFSDIHYNLSAKVMLLKIYYEKNEEEALLSLIFAFKMFLKRNKVVAKNVKEFYKNFIDILYQIKKYGKSKYSKISNQIEQTSLLNERTWLLEKLEELS